MDVQTLFNLKSSEGLNETMVQNPWLNNLFNTCELDPLPDTEERLGKTTVEAAPVAAVTSSQSGKCNWTLAGNDLYNNNQSGQVLVGTQLRSDLGARFVVEQESAGAQEKTTVIEMRVNTPTGTMTETNSVLLWSYRYGGGASGPVRAGGIGVGASGEWTEYTAGITSRLVSHTGNALQGLCTDGSYIYFWDNSLIQKYRISDATLITTMAQTLVGSAFAYLNGKIYITDATSDDITVRYASDLSLFGQTDLTGRTPYGICTDGTFIYETDAENVVSHEVRIRKYSIGTPLTLVTSKTEPIVGASPGDEEFNNRSDQMTTDGTYLWVNDFAANRIKKYRCSDLSYVTHYDMGAQVNAVHYADGYIYLGYSNKIWKYDANTWTLRYSWSSASVPYQICNVGPAIYSNDYTGVYEYIYVAEQSEYYFEPFMGFYLGRLGSLYEVARFTEDGNFLVGKRTGTGAAIDTYGDINSDASIDAALDVTAARSLESTVAVGTIPVVVTSTTLCTNLNADMVDGVHMGTMTANRLLYTSALGTVAVIASSVCDGTNVAIGGTTIPTDPGTPLFSVIGAVNATLSLHGTATSTFENLQFRNEAADKTWHLSMRNASATPAYNLGIWYHNGTAWAEFGHIKTTGEFSWPYQIISTLAIGTAPLAVTSTTVCTNLNADLWDGYQFADYLNQAVKTTSSPQFKTLGLNVAANAASWIYMVGDAGTTGTNQWAEYLNPTLSGTTVSGIWANQGHVKAGVTALYWKTIWIVNPTLDAGASIGTAYGIYIDAITAGSTNYSIYSAGGANYFAGATIGSLAGVVKGTAGVLSAIANTTSADYMGGDAAYHTLNQAAVVGLTSADGPSFDHLHLTVATGTAPMVVASTTVVSNLNANYLQGNLASAFALAAHVHALDDLSDVVAPTPGDGESLTWNAATSKWINAAAGGGHAMLSATHTDSTPAAIVRGDIIIGSGVAPKWTRLAVGAATTYLAGGTEPSWAALNQAAVDGLKTGDSPTHVGLALSGLTASLPVVTDGAKALASVAYATFKASLAIAQADVSGLHSDESPIFVTVKCSGLSNGYVPYHVSYAAGLADSPISYASSIVDVAGKFQIRGDLAAATHLTAKSADFTLVRIGCAGSGALLDVGVLDVWNAGTLKIQLYAAGDCFFNTGGAVLIATATAVGTEKCRVNGNLYIDSDCSALTFTDRP